MSIELDLKDNLLEKKTILKIVSGGAKGENGGNKHFS
jgi:hypothetical protein